MGLINNVKSSITYSRVKANAGSIIDKQRSKFKDDFQYAKDNPGKTAVKVVSNIAVNTVMPGGTIVKQAAKVATKKVIKKVVEKDRVKLV